MAKATKAAGTPGANADKNATPVVPGVDSTATSKTAPMQTKPKVVAKPGADSGATEDAKTKTGGVKPATVLDDPKFKDFIGQFVKSYPKEKLFLIASDWQVFLEANRAEAVEHQNGLDKNKAVCEYTV